MEELARKTLIVVVGPTAIGKTALAIRLAQQAQTEIISADSRQFFKEMTIGTAKPEAEELAAAPHHFIDSHSIHEFFSTGDFEMAALERISLLFQQKELLIAVGGSGLYINALCHGLDELPDIDLNIRAALNEQWKQEGMDAIRKQLAFLDPEYFDKVDQSNPQRMIRGLEMILSTGKKLSSMLTSQKKERPFQLLKIGLQMDRSELYERINRRVDLMMESGLLEEAQQLYPQRHLNALQTVGYTELFDYIEGKTGLESAVDRIKQNTRRFAKRQITWFKRDPHIHWFSPSSYEMIDEFLTEQLTIWHKTC